uniref:Uncharacterized protein n=1 Tax=Ananas comosus var. bracteatus TaxID=296719 RepID=A0A6V7PS04_ANACO|nr:unnamed protein product [Ananas comosus var. bracteatus]
MATTEAKLKSHAGVWSTVKPFVNGGASGMLATCVIQPIDMIKTRSLSPLFNSGFFFFFFFVRIQLGQGSALHMTKTMLAQEGFGSFYKMLCGLLLSDDVLYIGALFASGLLRALRFLRLHWPQLCHDLSTRTLNQAVVTDPSVREAVGELQIKGTAKQQQD